jgi:hypothetical protein
LNRWKAHVLACEKALEAPALKKAKEISDYRTLKASLDGSKCGTPDLVASLLQINNLTEIFVHCMRDDSVDVSLVWGLLYLSITVGGATCTL